MSRVAQLCATMTNWCVTDLGHLIHPCYCLRHQHQDVKLVKLLAMCTSTADAYVTQVSLRVRTGF